MTKLCDVLAFIRPDGEFVCYGENLADTLWLNDTVPVDEAELKLAKTAYEKNQKQIAIQQAEAKNALLAKLGITEEEAKLLLS